MMARRRHFSAPPFRGAPVNIEVSFRFFEIELDFRRFFAIFIVIFFLLPLYCSARRRAAPSTAYDFISSPALAFARMAAMPRRRRARLLTLISLLILMIDGPMICRRLLAYRCEARGRWIRASLFRLFLNYYLSCRLYIHDYKCRQVFHFLRAFECLPTLICSGLGVTLIISARFRSYTYIRQNAKSITSSPNRDIYDLLFTLTQPNVMPIIHSTVIFNATCYLMGLFNDEGERTSCSRS